MSELVPPVPIVLPLWPAWAHEVMLGRKEVEFRRRPFPAGPGQVVYLYATNKCKPGESGVGGRVRGRAVVEVLGEG